MIKNILFDLDGTLLPMDQEIFTKAYFKGLAEKLAPYGYQPEKLYASIWAGVTAMVKNDGSCRNEDAFWKSFTAIWGEGAQKDKPVFDAFYRKEFQKVQECCGYREEVPVLIRELREKGYRLVLATNPLFPAVATESRIRWAGLAPEDFEWVTTYENIGCCKPNLQYYEEILRRMGMKPEESVMVGNDVGEDMIAERLGIKVFLLTDCLINRKQADISTYPHGSFVELKAFLDSAVNKEKTLL